MPGNASIKNTNVPIAQKLQNIGVGMDFRNTLVVAKLASLNGYVRIKFIFIILKSRIMNPFSLCIISCLQLIQKNFWKEAKTFCYYLREPTLLELSPALVFSSPASFQFFYRSLCLVCLLLSQNIVFTVLFPL